MSAINILWISLTCIGSYLIGSIPFTVLFGRLFKGDDLRKHHTGNPGGFNAIRTFGLPIGLTALFLDILKGFITILVIVQIYSRPYFVNENGSNLFFTSMCIIGPALAILGHNYSIYINFSGGQGLSVFMGALFYVNPIVFAFYAITYILLVAVLKLSNRIAGLIVVILCIPVGLFLPLAPPWAHILNDWVAGGSGFLYVTQGLVVLAMSLVLLSSMLKNVIVKSKIGIEKMTEVG
ncbi:MAG: glycerol-3-phosphate acyltransferase [Candidatus Heimdallarchaeota archaeon]